MNQKIKIELIYKINYMHCLVVASQASPLVESHWNELSQLRPFDKNETLKK